MSGNPILPAISGTIFSGNGNTAVFREGTTGAFALSGDKKYRLAAATNTTADAYWSVTFNASSSSSVYKSTSNEVNVKRRTCKFYIRY